MYLRISIFKKLSELYFMQFTSTPEISIAISKAVLSESDRFLRRFEGRFSVRSMVPNFLILKTQYLYFLANETSVVFVPLSLPTFLTGQTVY